MAPELAYTVAVAFLLAVALTGAARRFAVSHGVIDLPNERSSHSRPTPRGGGIAIVVATFGASSFLCWRDLLACDVYLALTSGGVVVAVVGFLDDRRQLSARIRLSAHLAAGLLALVCLGGLPDLRINHLVVSFGWFGYILGALGVGWVLNLFNFMDGIDGIAASEAAFMVWAASLLALTTGVSGAIVPIACVFGAVCCGFLCWNWPPAKIFMGDVGSGYTGYVIAVLAIASARENPVALLEWLILGGVFFNDATLTLVRRFLRGEAVHEAHRTHAYQRLAERLRSHAAVTSAVTAVNVAWLLPCAWLALQHPIAAGWVCIAALAPVLLLAGTLGAGRPSVLPEQGVDRI